MIIAVVALLLGMLAAAVVCFWPRRALSTLGYYDKTGKLAITAPLFSSSTRPFHEGLAGVHLSGNSIGYIDNTGKLLFSLGSDIQEPPDGQGVQDFSEDLVAVKPDSHWGYADKTGKLLIPARFDDAMSFKEGLAPVKLGGWWGFIDHAGQFAIERQFQYAMPFSEGLAAVMLRNKIGYIDKQGTWVIKPQFDLATRFSEGLAYVDDRYYIDKTGNCVLDLTKKPDLESGPLKEELRWRTNSEKILAFYVNKCCLFDVRERVMVLPRMANVHRWYGTEEFHHGFTIVHALGSSRYIDRQGNYLKLALGRDLRGDPILVQDFLAAKPFAENVAAVCYQGRCRFIDAQGHLAILNGYDWATSFSDGLAKAQLVGQYFYINHAGQQVFGLKDRSGMDFSEGLAQTYDHTQ